METIGFIGVGSAGARLANDVLKAGHPLVVYDLREEAMEPFAEKGARVASSGKEAAALSDIIFTSLPATKEADEAARGPNGILEGIRAGSIYIDLSTRSESWIRDIEPFFDKQGAGVLEVTVLMGGDPRFQRSCGALLVGGDPQVYERVKPVLLTMSDRLIYCGGLGSATVCKFVHNMIGNSVRLAIAEGLTMAAKAGVDPLIAWESLRHGIVGKGRDFLGAAQALRGNFENRPGGFAFALARKDLALATEFAKSLNVPVGVHMATEAVASQAMSRGYGDKSPLGALYLVQEEIAGVEARNPAADVAASPDFITVHPDLLAADSPQ